jgi:rubrerythrin
LKKVDLFLHSSSTEQKEFLNLLDLTAKVHGENKDTSEKSEKFLWDERFFQLEKSSLWNSLNPEKQTSVLKSMTENILREAYFIETAGMSYAAKMNMTSLTKEERQFFCFVAEEEARHLRLVDSLFDFDKSNNNIPSFSLLIGDIIQDATRLSHLLLIQILLEGWGLNYYKSLAKETISERVSLAFKSILKDEIRHHSAGVILFSKDKQELLKENENRKELLNYIDKICKMIQIGPFTLVSKVFKFVPHPTRDDLLNFLIETDAVKTTTQKLELIDELISKALHLEFMSEMRTKAFFTPLPEEEMATMLYESMPEIFQPQKD